MPLPMTVNLTMLSNSGFEIIGGQIVNGAGDVNGDGLEDILISYPEQGASYVLFGKTDSASVDLTLEGTFNGFFINGSATAQAGYALGTLGDVNGDNRSEIIIGAPFANRAAGQAYVLFGKNDTTTIQLDNLHEQGYVINGINANDLLGFSVGGAGDINGDNLPDIIIGAPGANNFTGQGYAIFSTLNPHDINLNETFFGFIINGYVSDGLLGYAVSTAGDMNQDNKTDVLLGAPYAILGTGQGFIIFGSNSTSTIQLNDISTLGFAINGNVFGMHLGFAVSGGKDVNGDGLPDVLLGAPGNDDLPGQAYLVFGKNNTAPIYMPLLNSEGFVLQGNITGGQAGYAVSLVDDVNQDALADMLIGAPGNSNSTNGQIFLVYSSNFKEPINLGELSLGGSTITSSNTLNQLGISVGSANNFAGDGRPVILVSSQDTAYLIFDNQCPNVNLSTFDGLGVMLSVDLALTNPVLEVSGAGDVNGDGIPDAIIGVPGAGICYVVFNKNNTSLVNLNNLGLDGFQIIGGSNTGSWVNNAGDVNNDGKDDVIIGAFLTGQCYVVFGKSDNTVVELSNFDQEGQGFRINAISITDVMGGSVSGAGYINADDYADIVIGASHANGLSGQVYVVFGKNNTQAVNITSLEAGGFIINGANGQHAGSAVSGAGDVNGDGIDDIVIGSPSIQYGYVIFGKNDNSSIELSALGDAGFQMGGITGDLGRSVSKAGDVNGDGLADIIIGAPAANNTIGVAYVIFGKNNTNEVNFDALEGEGFLIYATSAINLGETVSGIGDMNGDGLDDVIIGTADNEDNIGQSYIVYGKNNSNPVNVNELGIQGIIVNGLPGVIIGGVGPSDGIQLVSGIGDINGDNKTDFIIAPPVNSTQAYIAFGCYNPNLAPLVSATPKPAASSSSPDKAFTGLQLAMLIGFPIGALLLLSFVAGLYFYKRSKNRYQYDSDDEENQFETQALLGVTEIQEPAEESQTHLLTESKEAERLYQKALLNSQSRAEGQADFTIVRQCLEQAINKGNIDALYELGRLNEREGRLNSALLPAKLKEALKYYKQAEEKGLKEAGYELIRAQYRLAQYYQAEAPNKALKYYAYAIQAGYLPAQVALQQMVAQGFALREALLSAQLNSHVSGQQARAADDNKEVAIALDYLNKAQQHDRCERSLVHLAVLYGCYRSLKRLIRENHSINLHDVIGKTPQDIARVNEANAFVSLIQEMEKNQKHAEKNEERFNQLLVQMRKHNEMKKSIDEELLPIEAVTLQQQIFAITEEDSYVMAKAELKSYLHVIDALKQEKVTGLLIALIKQLKSPPYLFAKILKGRAFQMHFVNDLIAYLQRLIQTIENAKSQLSLKDCPEPIALLTKIQHAYQAFIQQLSSARDEQAVRLLFRPKALVHGAGLRFRYLNLDAFQQLVVKAEAQYQDNQYGIHVVREYQGVHYKLQPHAPGVEFMVNSLAQIIVGQGTSTTALLNITYGQNKRIYLASKTVIGVNLEHILLHHPELVNKIQLRNFSAMILLSLLTDPQDGKPDNYMVKLILDDRGEVGYLRIIGIDNDIAFADAIVKQHYGINKDKHYINVKNALYFFPQMELPLDMDFRDYFLTCSPEVMVIQWLEALNKQNNEYMYLLKEGILSAEQFEELQLPIRLTPGMSVKLRDKIQKIQQALLENPQLTHRELLAKIEPILQRYYQTIQNKESHPWYATRKLYKAALLPSIEESLRLETKINSRHTLLTSLAYRNARNDEFEMNRVQTIQAAMEEFITAIALPNTDNPKQKSAIAYIGKLELIEQLVLKNESLLMRISLPELVQKFPRLKRVKILNCHQLAANDVILTALQNAKLEICLGNCSKISTAHEWQRISATCNNFNLIIDGKEINLSTKDPDALLRQCEEEGVATEEIRKFLRNAGKQAESAAREIPQELQTTSSQTSSFLQRQHQHHRRQQGQGYSSSSSSVAVNDDGLRLSVKGVGKK